MADKSLYGVLGDGTEIYKFTLINQNGMRAEVTNYGAILLSLWVKDKDGKLIDVALGCESLEGYFDNGSCLGATVGRNANRIKDGEFVVNGITYSLDKNDGPNNLHSGPSMYYNRVWDVESVEDNAVTFSLNSPDMDQGFPGSLNISVAYILTEDNELMIHYHGVSDKDTVINMTNHSFFNLDGHDAGSIHEHEAQIFGDYFTETDSRLIPNGKLVEVKGTPLDFNEPKTIGKEIASDYEPLVFGNGYDQNWVISGYDGTLRRAAVLKSNASGITMEVYTDLPGIQMYTGNFLDVKNAKNGAIYGSRDGVALETQYFPDSVNQDFINIEASAGKENPVYYRRPIFAAGEEYETVTIYKFV